MSTDPAVPDLTRLNLDAVRERLAVVRGERRPLGRGPVVNPPQITDTDGRIVVTWPVERGIVEVYPEVIEGWAETVNDLRAENREHERVDFLIRTTCGDLEREVERLRAELAERTHQRDTSCDLVVEMFRSEPEQEIGRYRSWLREALDGIRGHCGEDHGSSGCLHGLEDRIRREAGLA